LPSAAKLQRCSSSFRERFFSSIADNPNLNPQPKRIFFCMWLVVCLAAAIEPHPAHAQSHIWSKGFGSTGSDQAYKVAVDGSGNVIVTGFFSGTVNFGGGGLVSAGNGDVFVAKYSPDGTHLWSKRFGGAGGETGYAVAVDGNGDVVVTGSFTGTVDFGGGGLVSAGSSDIFVAKYSGMDGSYLWSKRFGSTTNDEGRAVAVDSGGNVVVTGGFSGTVNFGGTDLTSAGALDIFIAKFSGTDGSHVWSKGFGSATSDEALGLAVDGSSNVVVTGFFSGTVNFGGSDLTNTGFDIFIAKFFGTDGSHVWSKGFGGATTDEGLGVAVDGSSNVVVTGFFTGTVDFGGGGLTSLNGSSDIFLIKLSGTDGSHLWSKGLGSLSSDQGNGVAVDGSGNVVVIGTILGTVNFGGGYRTGGGSQDIFVAKFSGSDGSHLWSDAFGSANNEAGNAVAVDGSGNVVATGYFLSTMSFGGTNLVNAGGTDIFLVKLGGTNDLSQLWSDRAGSTSTDDGYAVAVDGSGNVVVTGLFQGTMSFPGTSSLFSNGGYDIFLAKFSGVDGSLLWSKHFGGTSDDAGRAVAFDSNGNVLLTGAFRNTANFGGSDLISASPNIGDIFVAKFDPNGNHLWSKRYGSTGVDAGRAIAADSSGNVVVAGFFSGTVDFGGGNRISAGGEDIFLAKFSGIDGSHIWSQRFGSTLDDEGASIALDSSGNAVVTGFFQGTVNFGGGNRTGGGNQDIFLAKFSSVDGSHLWSKGFGGTAADQSFGVALDGTGNAVVTGVFQNTVDFGGGGGGLTSAGSYDMFVAKYLGSDGSHVWSKRFGSTGDDEGRAVAVDGSGNVVVTGLFQNTVDFGGGGLIAADAFFGDVYVAKFSGNDGSHLWSKRFGGTGADGGLGIAVDSISGNVVVTGGFQATADFGGALLVSQGSDDIFLLKLKGTPASPVQSKRRNQITSQ
jgi:hypothetical protein